MSNFFHVEDSSSRPNVGRTAPARSVGRFRHVNGFDIPEFRYCRTIFLRPENIVEKWNRDAVARYFCHLPAVRGMIPA